MRRHLLLALIASGAVYLAGCQLTVDDIRPVHLRGGGEAAPEPPPQPEPKPKPEAGKDVIYVLGLHGID